MTLSAFSTASAADIEKLVMPGEVIEGHAKYEGQCSKCHRIFGKEPQKKLCLDCHDHRSVAVDVEKGTGFHGRSVRARETDCRHCHTEHKGRKFDAVRLDKDTFDHGMTDFRLRDAHVKAPCARCHETGKKYREAPGKCNDCHGKKDPHQGRLGKDCSECHGERSWAEFKYDHDRTDFPLKGKHRDVACALCHPGEKYKDIPKDCNSCHALNDVHNGGYGKECHKCHNASGWKKTSFDHDKTKFRLEGSHRDIGCLKCHTEKTFKDKPPKTCVGCHKNDDDHRGRYGEKCADCHTQKEWKKATFDHGKTKFALRGKHDKTGCDACHRGPVAEKKTPKDCNGCHRADDVHRGGEGSNCERCHSEEGWRQKVVFDHDVTRFPLGGLHAVTPCEQCHMGAAYRDTPRDCNECHAKDDEHKKTLGNGCDACHNPNGWRIWRFDHDKGTKFVLDGAHKGLDCRACHSKPAGKKVEQNKECSACHRKDDAHRGGFGLLCERCHTTKSFREIVIPR